MKNQNLKLQSITTLTGMGLVLLAHVLRGTSLNHSPFTGFVLGILPNFGAGLGLPGVIYVLTGWIFKHESSSRRQNISMTLAAVIAVIILVDWELVQRLVWDYSMDIYDLLASLIGGSAALGIWLGWSNKN